MKSLPNSILHALACGVLFFSSVFCVGAYASSHDAVGIHFTNDYGNNVYYTINNSTSDYEGDNECGVSNSSETPTCDTSTGICKAAQYIKVRTPDCKGSEGTYKYKCKLTLYSDSDRTDEIGYIEIKTTSSGVVEKNNYDTVQLVQSASKETACDSNHDSGNTKILEVVSQAGTGSD